MNSDGLYPWPAVPSVPYAPIPIRVPKSSAACWLSSPPVPCVWSSVPTKKNNCLSREYPHRGQVPESIRPRRPRNNGRASRQLPCLRIGLNAAPASRCFRHPDGWSARRATTRPVSAARGGKVPRVGVLLPKGFPPTDRPVDSARHPWHVPICCPDSKHP